MMGQEGSERTKKPIKYGKFLSQFQSDTLDQFTSSNVRKILTNDTIIIYKNNNKKQLQIL